MFKFVAEVASVAIRAHVVASVLHNTPDTYNQDLSPFVGGWALPGWRFFAPNPGIQNVHLLVRAGDGSGSREGSGEWRDVTPPVRHGLINIVWNPRSRGPKALFDFMQQLTLMNSNYAEFNWIRESLAYELVASAAKGFIGETDAQSYQFLLMNYFPSAPEDQRMMPLLVSEWIAIQDREVSS